MYLAIHKIAIEQMFLFCFVFLYELPIFAIQNFVNMQISFIGLLQVFKDCLGGRNHTLKIIMNTFTVRVCGKIPQLPNPFLWGGDNHSNKSKMQISLTD